MQQATGVQAEVRQARQELDRLLVRLKLAKEQIKQEKTKLTEALARVEDCQTAQTILQQVAQQIQHSAHVKVAEIVSKCLTAVFEHPYELRIEFERKRGRTEAKFLLYRDGHFVRPFQTSGGVRSVVSIALRIVSLILHLPPGRRILFLDEPFQGLSKPNLKKIGSLIETLSRELKVQFVIVTHDPELQVGQVIQL